MFLNFYIFEESSFYKLRVYTQKHSHTHTHTSPSTYLKKLQWLNVRAVCAIKASMFDGRTPLPVLPLLAVLSLLIPLTLPHPLPLLSPQLSRHALPPPLSSGWFQG